MWVSCKISGALTEQSECLPGNCVLFIDYVKCVLPTLAFYQIYHFYFSSIPFCLIARSSVAKLLT